MCEGNVSLVLFDVCPRGISRNFSNIMDPFSPPYAGVFLFKK